MSKETPVGFKTIRIAFELDTDDAGAIIGPLKTYGKILRSVSNACVRVEVETIYNAAASV